MTGTELALAAVMLLVGLVIVVLNDKTKPKSQQEQQPPEVARTSRKTWFYSILITGVIIAVIVMFPGIAANAWIIPVIVVGVFFLILVLLSRKALWLYLKAILTGGKLPSVAIENERGEIKVPCPYCSSPLVFRPASDGETVVKCERCGGTVTYIPPEA